MSAPSNVSKRVLTNTNIRTTGDGYARIGEEVGTFLRRNKKNSERKKGTVKGTVKGTKKIISDLQRM